MTRPDNHFAEIHTTHSQEKIVQTIFITTITDPMCPGYMIRKFLIK